MFKAKLRAPRRGVNFGFSAKCNPNSPKARDRSYYCNGKTGRWIKLQPIKTPDSSIGYKHRPEHTKFLTKRISYRVWGAYIESRYSACVIGDFDNDRAMIIDLRGAKPILMIGPDTFKTFTRCKRRFVLGFIKVMGLFDDNGRHANALLFDKTNRKIYHFEPNGPGGKKGGVNKPKVENIIRRLPYDYEYFKDYTVVLLSSVCPRFGPQIEEIVQRKAMKKEIGREPGYCMAWTMLFLHYCINNPTVDPEHIVIYLLGKDDLTERIRRYVAYLVDFIKVQV